MKKWSIAIVVLLAFIAILITGCPSPFSGVLKEDSGDQGYETTAKVVTDSNGGLVFVEEDGSETAVMSTVDGVLDGPVELIDYAVLDDSPESGRSSSGSTRIRCVVVGRRSDGRSGVWIIYRHLGVVVPLNEKGLKDSALMELVEVNGSPWLGDDWVYDAKAVSDDGLVIIGQLSRPKGWEYLSGDVPEPSIGVWWNLYYRDSKLIVSRARPILMMNKPVLDASTTRCSYQERYRKWLDMLIEWIQAYFLDHSWNYLADATEFVLPGVVDGGITDGSYVIAGPDKYGVDAWAWITAGSVYNIEDAPVLEPPANNPPWPVTGPTERIYMTNGSSFFLVVTDDLGNEISEVGPFDPNKNDVVNFDPVIDTELSDSIPVEVFKTLSIIISTNGEFSLNWMPDGERYDIFYDIYTEDLFERTSPLNKIQIRLY